MLSVFQWNWIEFHIRSLCSMELCKIFLFRKLKWAVGELAIVFKYSWSYFSTNVILRTDMLFRS